MSGVSISQSRSLKVPRQDAIGNQLTHRSQFRIRASHDIFIFITILSRSFLIIKRQFVIEATIFVVLATYISGPGSSPTAKVGSGWIKPGGDETFDMG